MFKALLLRKDLLGFTGVLKSCLELLALLFDL